MKKLAFLLTILVSCAFQKSNTELALLWTAGWSADGKYIAVGGDNNKLSVLLASDLSIVKTLPFESMTLPSVAWHPAENLLAFSAYAHDRKKNLSTLQILNMETGKSIELDKLGGRGITWSPDGSKLALGHEGIISIFSKEGKKIWDIQHPSGRSLFSVSWHPEKNMIAAADDDVRLFDTETGKEVLAVKVADIPKAILCVRWHPSGEFFAIGDYGHEGETEPSYLKFFAEDGKHIKTMIGSKGAYRGMEWSADGSKIATVSDSLRIWSRNGDLLVTANKNENGIWGVDWNGSNVVTGGNSVFIWDDKGNLLRSYKKD